MVACGKFHFDNLNDIGPKTDVKSLLFSNFPKFDRFFNGRFCSNALNMHILVQQVKISQNRQFVFEFMSLLVLTFFSTVILTLS